MRVVIYRSRHYFEVPWRSEVFASQALTIDHKFLNKNLAIERWFQLE
jgi:hypothetical protein